MIGLSRLITVTATPPLYRLARLALSRFYSPSASAAAQPQADYYYYGAESESERLAAAAMADSEGSGPNRGVQWVFIGNPGAKRHVYAVRLAKLLEVPHISMASLVRQDLSPRSALYKQIANAVNHGELVPEDIIFGLLSKRLEDGYYQGENGFILDGIPRSPIQAGILDQLAEIDLVVNFKCTEDCLVKHQRDGTWKEKLQVYAKQEHGTSHLEGTPLPSGSSQHSQQHLGRTTACTSAPARRGKTIVPTVDKAIAVMESNKRKRKKPDWQKY